MYERIISPRRSHDFPPLSRQSHSPPPRTQPLGRPNQSSPAVRAPARMPGGTASAERRLGSAPRAPSRRAQRAARRCSWGGGLWGEGVCGGLEPHGVRGLVPKEAAHSTSPEGQLPTSIFKKKCRPRAAGTCAPKAIAQPGRHACTSTRIPPHALNAPAPTSTIPVHAFNTPAPTPAPTHLRASRLATLARATRTSPTSPRQSANAAVVRVRALRARTHSARRSSSTLRCVMACQAARTAAVRAAGHRETRV